MHVYYILNQEGGSQKLDTAWSMWTQILDIGSWCEHLFHLRLVRTGTTSKPKIIIKLHLYPSKTHLDMELSTLVIWKNKVFK